MVDRTASITRLEEAYLGDALDSTVEDMTGLALSGGGYKACLFHLGGVIRLNELGLLRKIDRIASVSGGSITAAMLALHWRELGFDPASGVGKALHAEVVAPLWRFCLSAKIDKDSLWRGLVDLRRLAGDYLEKNYKDKLLGPALMRDLVQEPAGPRFTFHSTSAQLNSLWRFTQLYARNYRIGEADIGDVPLARIVAASSAFPPILSPVKLDFAPGAVRKYKDADRCVPPYNERALLMDGGVYDNMGLESVWKRCRTVLVCNAGDPFPEAGAPSSDWASQLRRAIRMVHRHAENNRLRWLFALDRAGDRKVTYWGIRGRATAYPKHGPALTPEQAREAGLVKVELWPTKLRNAQLLLAHGYSMADAAARSFWVEAAGAPPPPQLPIFDAAGDPAKEFSPT